MAVELEDYAEYRRRRVKRLKKLLPRVIVTAILIPLIATIVLAICLYNTRKELNGLQSEYDSLLQTMSELKDEIAYTSSPQDVYSVSTVKESERDITPETETDEAQEIDADTPDEEQTLRTVYLTFDDGPSSGTSEILDILSEYGVHATFFVVGKTDQVSIDAYKRIVDEGHTLGMHSYSHRYSEIYSSAESFQEDLTKLQEYLYEVTGVWSRYYRFPGGSSNTASSVDMGELIKYLDEQDITYFDWNIVSGDASGYTLSADKIFENCTAPLNKYNNSVILMHDAQAKHSTVEALPRIIEYIQAQPDMVIAPIGDDTVLVQHRTNH